VSAGSEPKVVRWVAAFALLPAPLWLLWSIATDAGPVWRARYFSAPDFQGEAFELRERHISEIFDATRHAPGESLSPQSFSARWDTCLELRAAREIPFQLVAEGSARFVLDGQEKLRVQGAAARATRGEVLRLEAGSHHLQVEFSTPAWPGVALNASFDGHAPIAVVGSVTVPGVKLLAPRVAEPPCGAVP
jgi:hypothetical protein